LTNEKLRQRILPERSLKKIENFATKSYNISYLYGNIEMKAKE